MSSWSPGRVTAAVGAAAFLAQLPGVTNTFLFDDLGLVARSDLYTSPARWLESVSVPFARVTVFYRPAGTTSYLLESLVHGGVAWGFRLTAALLFATAAALAFRLLHRLTGSVLPAAFAALLWALHPAQVETATWISARFDLLSVVLSFGVLALLSAPGASATPRVAATVLLTSVACLAKEPAFGLPALAALWVVALRDRPGREVLRAATVVAAGAALALFVRWEALGEGFRGPETITSQSGFGERALLVGRSIAAYLRMFVVPWGGVGPIHAGERPIPAGDASGWAGLVLGAAILALTAVAWRRRSPAAPLLTAAIVAVLPSIQLVPLDVAGGVHACDRYLFLPSFFAVAAIVVALRDVLAATPSRARAAGIAATALLVAFVGYRLALLHRWNDPERFWEWTAEVAPGNPTAETNLAFVKESLGKSKEAEIHARRGGAEGREALIDSLVAQGRLEDALDVVDDAIAESPAARKLLLRRGEIALALKRWPQAAGDLQAAIEAESESGHDMEPVTARAHAGIAEAIVRAGGPESESRRHLATAESLVLPAEWGTWLRIARARLLLGDVEAGRRAMAKSLAAGAPQARIDELEEAIRRHRERSR